MNLDLLVCPACRTVADGRVDVRTLDREGDLLVCACGRRYPIVDGVPILLASPAAFLRSEIATVVERDLAPEVAAALAEGGPDDAPYARLLEHLSIYVDAHWGDVATPPAPFASPSLRAKIAARAHDRVDVAVELGCSLGRFVAELAPGADHVIGVDLHHGAVRRARRILGGEAVPYARRVIGRHYAPARVQTAQIGHCTFVCGDALDPPLIPQMFGRVVALNLLDSVHAPRQLLSVVDVLCARGGEIILTSPYSWQSSVMADADRLGGRDPAAEVRRLFTAGEGLSARYTVEDEDEIAWTLQRDTRSATTYRTHYLRLRKP